MEDRRMRNDSAHLARFLAGGASVGVLALACLSATDAVAQAQPGARSPVELEDVVVTARRVEENIQEVPVAVTAVSQATLDELVVDNVSDLNKLAPGLQINGCVSGSLTGGSMCQVTIRGFTSTRNTAFGSIATYFGDAPGMFTSNFDLQSIQVLKGPQGTLFGDTTTGGALLYTPRKPSGERGGFVSAEVGNYSYRELTAAYEDAVLDDRVRFRVAGQYRDRGGYATAHYSFGGTEKVGDVHQLYLRGSLVLRPIDRLENYTVLIYQQDKSNGGVQPISYTDPRFFNATLRNTVPANNPTTAAAYEFFTGRPPPAGLTWPEIALQQLARQTAAGPYEVWSDLDQRIDRISAGVVNQTRFDITDNWYVRNIFGVRWIPRRSGGSANYDGADAPFLQITGFRNLEATNAHDGNYDTLDNGWNNRLWTNEVQVVGNLWDGRLQAQFGYFHREDRPGDFYGDYPYPQPSGSRVQIIQNAGIAAGNLSPAACAAAGAPTPCFTLTRFSRKSDALFAQGTFALTDAINLTGGVRRSIVDEAVTETAAFQTTLVTYRGSGGGTAVLPLPVAEPNRYLNAPVTRAVAPGYKSLTYTLTADWKVNEDTLVYLAHRKGFKPGGVNAALPADDPLREYKPESLKDIEAGLKMDWSIGGITGRTNLAAYKIWYSDIQTQTRFGGGITLVQVNGGEADFKGFEIETTIIPAQWFSLSGQLSYQHNRYTEYAETTFCRNQTWRQVAGGTCAGLPADTPIRIDHARGVLTIAPANGPAQIYTFRPPRFNPPLTWSLRPEFRFEPWLGEDITAGFNISYSSGEHGLDFGPANFAGVTPFVVDSWMGPQSGLDAYEYQGYTLVDFNADWRRIRGSNVSAYVRVTNLTKELYRVGSADTFVSGGTGAPSANEPRMFLVGLKYDF